MASKTEKVILAIIIFIGAVLRLYNYWDFSLSNDELSALARLNFSSFNDLLHNGIKIDGHPAAAQTILFYVNQVFGYSVAVVRLPFVLAGIASVYFMYKAAKEWVSSSAGLLAAATFATLAFPVLYSRIARPYALGMLFTLMAISYWIRIVKERGQTKDYILLGLSLALCGYSHYFSALVGAILAFSGTFLITGRNLKLYLFALVGAFILYVPYIPIFLHQLSLGGVGQWLGPPNNDWLLIHIKYLFNDSWFVLVAVITACILGFVFSKPRMSFQRNVLPLLMFLAPFIVGFAYSKYVNPVLQHSTLLFSFPFLLVFIFSGWDDLKPKVFNFFIGVLAIVILGSTIVEKRFYGTNHFGVFKELAEHLIEWNEESGNDALLVGDFNYPFYLHYYTDQIEPVELDLYRTTDDLGLANLKALVDKAEEEFLIYSWSTINQTPEVVEIVLEKYPIELNRVSYFNSEVMLFQKGEVYSNSDSFQFEKTEIWNFNPDAIIKDGLGQSSIVVSGKNPYGPTYHARVSNLHSNGISEIIVRIECLGASEESSLQLVYEQVNENGGYAWESDEFKRQFTADGPNWGVFHYGLKAFQTESDVLKIYPWLPDGNEVYITSMSVSFR